MADRLKVYCTVAGLDARRFAGHSLRRGFITTAARDGKDYDSIRVVSRHESERVLRGYIERENLHERGAGEGLL